jgi:gas vesicle protein
MSRPLSLLKMKKLSIHESHSNATPTKKGKKVKSKEEKELKKTFETIARRLLSNACEEIRNDVESRLREIISRTNSEIRHEILSTESALSSRLTNLETKTNNILSKLEESHQDTTKKIEKVQDDLKGLVSHIAAQHETERNKRLVTAKKLQEKFDSQLQSLQNNVTIIKQDNSSLIASLNDDLRIQVKDVAALKEKLDEL